jgi:tripartite-type tricarboxylate transporter receptor subunit TctC
MLLGGAALTGTFAGSVLAQPAGYPQKPVRVVVASGPGGASDVVARMFQRAFDKVSPHPMVVQNMPGGGTSIGAREVALADPDGHHALMMHEGVISAAAQGIFNPGMSALAPVASTGRDVYTVVVHASSPYKTLGDLIAAAKKGVVRTSVNIGGLNHMTSLIVADAGGVTIRPVQTGSGADSVRSVLGKQTEVIFTVPSDVTSYVASGDMRILAVLDEKRSPFVPDVPTAAEAGFPAVSRLTHMWWMPKGTPQERIAWMEGTLKAAMSDATVAEALKVRMIDSVFLSSTELDQYIQVTNRKMDDFVKRFNLKQ